jgi:hypothetical protein
MGRVVIGGLLAGLIVNISEFILNGVVFAEEMNAAMASLNRPPIAQSMIIWFVVFGFGLGIVLVWLYAAIRPRYGPGVRTALCAGLAIWGLAYLYPTLFFLAMKLFPTRLTVISTIWGLGEVLVAAVAGAWLYKET